MLVPQLSNILSAIRKATNEAVIACFRKLMRETAKEILNRKGAASFLGVSVSYLEKAAREGKGPPYRKVGGINFYMRSDLILWVEKHPKCSVISEPSLDAI